MRLPITAADRLIECRARARPGSANRLRVRCTAHSLRAIRAVFVGPAGVAGEAAARRGRLAGAGGAHQRAHVAGANVAAITRWNITSTIGIAGAIGGDQTAAGCRIASKQSAGKLSVQTAATVTAVGPKEATASARIRLAVDRAAGPHVGAASHADATGRANATGRASARATASTSSARTAGTPAAIAAGKGTSTATPEREQCEQECAWNACKPQLVARGV